nr:hypothetical protein [Tanacetum cinerariifolium]
MIRDVITVGLTMRIPLLYRGEYSQWRERFMNYLEEQMDGEAMINSIHNGDQPLHTAEEKKTRKIDHLARSLLIQGLSNDIYSLIDSNETAKDLWDALERQMCGSEYAEQDRKAVILYEYETFKATEGEQLLDTYLCYLQVINDLKKCGYKKDNCEFNYKFLNNLQPEWKHYGTVMRQTKNLMDINIDALYNIIKQNQGDVNDALGYKKKAVVVTSDPLALVAEKTKVSKRKEKVVVSSDSKGSAFVITYIPEKMSRDVLTVGSTMRIPLLYRGEYSQWIERFMNYLEEQTDVEEMINSIKNDKSMWSDQEKKIQKIDRLARSLLIQGLLNDIYSLIDSNKTAKDLWDALARHMLGSEYDEQDRKVVVLDVNDAMGLKKKIVVVTSDPLALIAKKTKVSKSKEKVVVSLDSKRSDADEFSELKKITALLAKAFNRRKFYSKLTNNNLRTSSTSQSANKKQEFAKMDDKKVEKKDDEKKRDMSKCSNQEINANMVFMAQIDKVLLDSEASSSSTNDKISEVSYYLSESESEFEYETSEYCINTTTYGLFVNDNDDQEIFHDCENFPENLIESQIDHNESAIDDNDSEGVDMKQIADQEVLYDKMSVQLVELDKHTVHMIMPSKDTLYNGRKGIGFENPRYFEKANDLRPCLYDEKVIGLGYIPMFITHSDEALEIEKFKRARENKIQFAYDYGSLNASYVNEKINFLDDYFQEIINPNFDKIDSSFQQTSSLKPYVPTMILEKIIIDLEDEVVSLLEKEKANLETIESLKSKGFELSENAISETKNQNKNDCQVVKKECDQVENSKVIAPGMFKLSVPQSVSPISVTKTCCDSKYVENKTKRKRHKRKSSKQNDKQVNNDVSRANSDFVHFSDLDTFSSVIRTKQSSVIWKKRGSSNTSNVDLSSVSHSKLNKDVKRYSRKDLLSCNNSHLRETSSAYDCNDAMNVSCNYRFCDSFDENNLFIFDDESVRISPVSKMPFRKKHCDSMNIVYICLWIIDSACSKHMTGNRALLTNFVEKFLGTVRFGNNDFAMIACYGDVIHKSVNVNFDEISEMASKQFSLEPVLSNLNGTGKSSNPSVSQVLESLKKDLEDLFQKFYDEYFDASKIMKSSTTNVETLIKEEVFHEVSESFQGESNSSSLNDDVQQSSKEVGVPSSNTQSISNYMIPNVDETSTSHNVFNE